MDFLPVTVCHLQFPKDDFSKIPASKHPPLQPQTPSCTDPHSSAGELVLFSFFRWAGETALPITRFTCWRCCSWRHHPGRGNLARHPPCQGLGWGGLAPARGGWTHLSCRTQTAKAGPVALAQRREGPLTQHRNLAPVLVLLRCWLGWQAEQGCSEGSHWQLQETWDLGQHRDKTRSGERVGERYRLRFIYYKSYPEQTSARKDCRSDFSLFSCCLILVGSQMESKAAQPAA